MKRNTEIWDWPLAALYFLLAFTAAGRLVITRWAEDLGRIQTVAALGAVLGLALTVSSFRPLLMRLIVTGYTLGVLPWQFTAILEAESDPLLRLTNLWGRLGAGWSQLQQGQAVQDPLLFIAAASLFFWFTAILSARLLFEKRQFVAALLPLTLPVLIVQYYDGRENGHIWALAFYFFLALLALGRLNLLENHARWRRQGIFVGLEPGFDLTNGLLTASTLLVFTAWMLPVPFGALPAAAHWWKDATAPLRQNQQALDDALAALGSQPAQGGERYGSLLALGTSAGQGDVELFRVRTPENDLPRLYWRARVYDKYENGNWSNSLAQVRDFKAASETVQLALPASKSGEFTIEWRSAAQRNLFTPGQTEWVSRASSLAYMPLPENREETLFFLATQAVQNGESYRARAGIASPSLQALRSAPETLPTWVKDRYLQLPSGLSGRLQPLAKEITQGAANRYDQAAAITQYLRQNMRYSTTVESPPPGADPVTWFLFTWKSGFCNYYASSEVLLLRSLGIPARMVVGYAQGEGVGNNTFRVRGRDAHAWPEVYFEGLGWVEFEPTANQPSLNRRSEETLSGGARPNTPQDAENQQQLRREGETAPGAAETPAAATTIPGTAFWLSALRKAGGWVIIFAAAAALAWLVWKSRKRWHFLPRALQQALLGARLPSPGWLNAWVRWSEAGAAVRAFEAVNQALLWLGGQPLPPSATAQERAAALKRLLPQAQAEVAFLATLHEQALFAPAQALNVTPAPRAAWKVRWLAAQALFSRWLYGA